MLEDCFYKLFSSEGDNWSFSLAPDSPAELVQLGLIRDPT